MKKALMILSFVMFIAGSASKGSTAPINFEIDSMPTISTQHYGYWGYGNRGYERFDSRNHEEAWWRSHRDSRRTNEAIMGSDSP